MDRRIPCPTCQGGGKASTRRNELCWNCGGSGQTADPAKPAAKPPPRAKPAKAARAQAGSGFIDGIGKLIALGAAIAAGVWAHGAVPDAPPAWFIAAAIAGAFAWSLRKLIIFGGTVVGIGMAFLEDERKTGPQQAAVVPAPVPRTAASSRATAIGVCLRNSAGRPLTYTLALPGMTPAEERKLNAGEQRVLWKAARNFDKRPDRIVLLISDVNLQWDLPLDQIAVATEKGEIRASDLSCGRNGLPIREIFQEKGKLWVRQIQG